MPNVMDCWRSNTASQGLVHTTGKYPPNSVTFPALHFHSFKDFRSWRDGSMVKGTCCSCRGIPFQFLIPRREPLSGDPTPSNLPRQTWCTYIKAGTYKHIIILIQQQQKPPSFSMHLSMCTCRGQIDKGSQLCSYGKAVLVFLATEPYLQSLFSFCSRISFECFQAY